MTQTDHPPLGVPSLRRRFYSMAYEGMLLFGVVFIAAWLFSTLLQQRHALYLRGVLQYWLFFVLAAYFIWFWTHGGQTLAMKTWRIRLVPAPGRKLTILRAACRYLLAWGWFVPGLLAAWMLDAKGWMLVLAPTLNVVAWGLLAFADPHRQFLHDRLAGTQLRNSEPAARKP